MATFNLVDSIGENLAEGKIDFSGDTLKVVLSNIALAASDSVLADITEISAGNGYTSGGETVTVASSSQASGTYKLVLDDFSLTALGGSIGPFRYFVLVDTTASGSPIVGWWDYGSEVTLSAGQSIGIDFSAAEGVLQMAAA
jgi:hypothetical protein